MGGSSGRAASISQRRITKEMRELERWKHRRKKHKGLRCVHGKAWRLQQIGGMCRLNIAFYARGCITVSDDAIPGLALSLSNAQRPAGPLRPYPPVEVCRCSHRQREKQRGAERGGRRAGLRCEISIDGGQRTRPRRAGGPWALSKRRQPLTDEQRPNERFFLRTRDADTQTRRDGKATRLKRASICRDRHHVTGPTKLQPIPNDDSTW